MATTTIQKSSQTYSWADDDDDDWNLDEYKRMHDVEPPTIEELGPLQQPSTIEIAKDDEEYEVTKPHTPLIVHSPPYVRSSTPLPPPLDDDEKPAPTGESASDFITDVFVDNAPGDEDAIEEVTEEGTEGPSKATEIPPLLRYREWPVHCYWSWNPYTREAPPKVHWRMIRAVEGERFGLPNHFQNYMWAKACMPPRVGRLAYAPLWPSKLRHVVSQEEGEEQQLPVERLDNADIEQQQEPQSKELDPPNGTEESSTDEEQSTDEADDNSSTSEAEHTSGATTPCEGSVMGDGNPNAGEESSSTFGPSVDTAVEKPHATVDTWIEAVATEEIQIGNMGLSTSTIPAQKPSTQVLSAVSIGLTPPAYSLFSHALTPSPEIKPHKWTNWGSMATKWTLSAAVVCSIFLLRRRR